jgi:hypothetical protein
VAQITADDALNGTFQWALWKVLDFLSTRYLPGSLLDNPQRAGGGGEGSGTGALTSGIARDTGVAPVPLEAALAAMSAIDPGELQTALATLGDDDSPLVRSLAWALGAPGLDAETRQYRLEASLMTLSRAEAFALLALVLYAAQQQ